MNTTAKTTATDDPRIYRACLACYNDGRLIGEWFDATDPDATRAWEEEHKAKTGHEEYAVHDYDSMPSLGEYPDLDEIAEWAALVQEHGSGAVRGFVDVRGEGYAKPGDFADAYLGTFDSETAYAEEYVDSTGMLNQVNDTIKNYFDYESFARDLFMSDLVSVDVDGGIAVFDRNS